MKKKTTFLVFWISVFLLGIGTSDAKIYIDIHGVSQQSFPIALVQPVLDGAKEDPEDIGKKFIETVRSDLSIMGMFRIIEPAAFLEDPKKKAFTADKIDFASWVVLDALALAKGWYRVDGDRVTIEMHLFDVLLRRELTGKRYEGKKDQIEWMAHRFANQVMESLTGYEGIFETKIAYIGKVGQNKELFVMDFDGSNVDQLTRHGSLVLSPAWSSDGKSIYYTAFTNEKAPQLYRYEMESQRSRKLTRFPGMTIGLDVHPSKELIATTLTKDGNSEVYLLDTSGDVEKRLTSHYAIDVSASFSPDGNEIVFVSDRDGSAQIYKMSTNGGTPQRLTFKGKNNTAPVWSPRGDKIAFAGMDTDGHFDIFTMDTDGSNMLRLTYDSRNNEEPSWAPGGQLITFASNRTGRYQIYSMRPDGSHQIRLTKSNSDQLMPVWSARPK